MAITTFFSGGSIDRSAEIRSDPDALASAWQAPESRIVALWQSHCLIERGAAVLLTRAQVGSALGLEDVIYLGCREERHLFCVGLPEDLNNTGLTDSAFENFRGLLGDLAAEDAALLAYAKGMLEWRIRHQHCGKCGTRNEPQRGGFVMACPDAHCENKSFPRIDPAIIVLVVDQADSNRCLLGRQHSWPEGRYSTVAGFVEPGESFEDAVAREVFEETNVQAANAVYLGSQPWPFPTGMMVGFHANADSSRAIQRHDNELADARWVSREELLGGELVLPPVTSIAFRLIEHWFDQWDGAPLRSFNLSGDFSRRSGERT
jgi:NAD+ diphosphatase